MRTLRIETAIAADPATVFDLELDMAVHAASMAASGERATTSSGSMTLGLGDEVTFAARHFGIPFRLVSRIVELDRPNSFVDEQVRGPFRAMRHEHRFAATAAGTLMTDVFSFSSPVGFAIAPYLGRLLVTRGHHIRRAAEAAAMP